MEAVRLARAAGAIISFDPNLRLSLWPDRETAREKILQAAAKADIIKLNEEELAFLTGCSILADGIEALLSGELFSGELSTDQCTGVKGPRLIAVTRGAAGAVLYRQGLPVEIPALPVNAVDTTGAGDVFMAGMLVVMAEAIRQGLNVEALAPSWIERLGRWGIVAAALTCTRTGVIPALPTKEEVAKLAT